MKKLIPILLLSILWSCTQQKSVERPRDVWVFRSVLDEKPRMVSAALHDNMWVAYDTQNGLLYKTWKGNVKLEGAVYTTAHGPQPISEGSPYFQMSEDKWVLEKEGKQINVGVIYKGHRIQNGVVEFNWDLITPEGNIIQLSESPEYIERETQSGLERSFKIENNTTYSVLLQTSLGFLQNENDYETDGKFKVTSSETQNLGDIEVALVNGLLFLNHGQTSLKVIYHSEFEKIVLKNEEETEKTEELVKGATLIDGSDCRACHNEELKTVGPAYLTVAKKYNDDENTVDLLAKRIIKGGAGVWGDAPMTPHTNLEENDIKEMVRYILSLDDDLATPFDKFSLGQKSIPPKLVDKYEGGEGAGFMAHLYVNDQGLDFLDVSSNLFPVKQGVANKIHTLSEIDFGEFRENIVVEYTGNLKIDKDGSYDFRLISDDGSYLYLDNKLIIDNGGYHGPQIRDGEMYLKAGSHPIKVVFWQGGGGAMVSLQWFDKDSESFVLLDETSVSYTKADLRETKEYVPKVEEEDASIPGDAAPLVDVHPSFDLYQARPDDFRPRVGGIDFLEDDRMVVCTWDSTGAVYVVENWKSGDPSKIKQKRIAFGLAEPLGLKVVDNEIYILQKQELTKLIDHDGDELIDEYRTLSAKWKVSANFHEFAFGLVYQDGYFYGTLATAILPGGASANPQIPDRGKVVKINKETGDLAFIAYGLRTPNGIGEGVDNQLFVADNQGDWLPASKIVHVKEGAFYGSRSVDFEGTEGVPETLPVVWLPQDEIGNSPSTPIDLRVGPYAGQMIHGEVTNGGIKRVFVEKVEGEYQGALFRFSQGFEAGVNRILWAPDGSLMVGGVGSSGNWSHMGKGWFGLQRLVYNEKTTFEMLKVSVLSNGFEIEFTEPIKEGQNVHAENFLIQQWRYEPTSEYGGPKLDLEDLKASKMDISEDRKKVIFEIPGLKENHVVYFRIIKPFNSQSGQDLWSTECWYTLNRIPEGKMAILK